MKFNVFAAASVAAFALGCGMAFQAVAAPTCQSCYSSCQTKYNLCIAAGNSTLLCISRYRSCISTCPCPL